MNSLIRQEAFVYPPQTYFGVKETNCPFFTVIQRTQTGGCFEPTDIGAWEPPPVQPFTPRI
jgi:hypothetical protein